MDTNLRGARLPSCDSGVAWREIARGPAVIASPAVVAATCTRGEPVMNQRPLLHVLVLSLAIVLAGVAIGSGVQRFRLSDRSVTVKGVAERPVKADIALWPMLIVASGMELGPTQDKLAADQRAVRRFFA